MGKCEGWEIVGVLEGEHKARGEMWSATVRPASIVLIADWFFSESFLFNTFCDGGGG